MAGDVTAPSLKLQIETGRIIQDWHTIYFLVVFPSRPVEKFFANNAAKGSLSFLAMFIYLALNLFHLHRSLL